MGAAAGCGDKQEVTVTEQGAFTAWQYGSKAEDANKLDKMTRFRLTFSKHVVNENSNPFDTTLLPGENQKWFGIKLEVKNIGSKWSPINYDCFVIMKDGAQYRLAPRIEGKSSGAVAAFGPNEAGVIQLTCRISKEAEPVEVLGLIGAATADTGATKVHCRLH